jgi:hypothetical protein
MGQQGGAGLCEDLRGETGQARGLARDEVQGAGGGVVNLCLRHGLCSHLGSATGMALAGVGPSATATLAHGWVHVGGVFFGQ